MDDTLVGRRFGDWTVVSSVEGRPWLVVVRCACGTEGSRRLAFLERGLTKSCQPCATRRTHAERRSRTENASLDYIPSWLYAHIRDGAKKRRRARPILFDVTRDYLTDLFRTQDGRCALSGVPLVVKPRLNRDGLRQRDTTASLDRIDSAGGYVPGNVQWVHKVVNVMKQSLPVDEFVTWCALVVRHCDETLILAAS